MGGMLGTSKPEADPVDEKLTEHTGLIADNAKDIAVFHDWLGENEESVASIVDLDYYYKDI